MVNTRRSTAKARTGEPHPGMTGRKSGAHDNNTDMGNKAQGEDYGPVH
jgi:hypothetical protein